MHDVIIACVISAIVCVIITRMRSRGKNYPPGSRGIPFLGSVPFCMESLERTLAVWGWQNYGPVFFFTRGSCRTVVLNTYEAASEGFVKQGNHLSGRFDPKHKHKLFADYTEKWQEQRKLRVMALKGLGKINLEEVISSECEKLMEKITSMRCGFEAGYLLATPTFNVIRKVIYGETAGKGNSYEDKLSKILSGPVYDVEGGVWRALVDLFPQVRSSLTFERMVEKKVKERIDKVREQITGSQEFMDEMLQKIQDWENGECYNDKQLFNYITDLFMAGTDTMATTVHWSLVFLAQNPEIQNKMAAEIIKVTGNDIINVSMMESMPYTRAVMYESTRMRPVFPLSLGHQATSDVTVKDNVIPKGTLVVANLWAIQNDPKWWKNPESFRPERHITENGGFTKNEKIVPFSIGPRFCLGSQMATYHQFIFLANLVRTFKFRFHENQPEPDLTGVMTSVLAPVGIRMMATKR